MARSENSGALAGSARRTGRASVAERQRREGGPRRFTGFATTRIEYGELRNGTSVVATALKQPGVFVIECKRTQCGDCRSEHHRIGLAFIHETSYGHQRIEFVHNRHRAVEFAFDRANAGRAAVR